MKNRLKRQVEKIFTTFRQKCVVINIQTLCSLISKNTQHCKTHNKIVSQRRPGLDSFFFHLKTLPNNMMYKTQN